MILGREKNIAFDISADYLNEEYSIHNIEHTHKVLEAGYFTIILTINFYTILQNDISALKQ